MQSFPRELASVQTHLTPCDDVTSGRHLILNDLETVLRTSIAALQMFIPTVLGHASIIRVIAWCSQKVLLYNA